MSRPDNDFEQFPVSPSSLGAGPDTAGPTSSKTRLPRPGPSLKARAIGFLSRREHSRLELQRKLAPHADPDNPDAVGQVLDELEKGGWLSNQRFAQSLAHRRAPRKAAALVVQELRQHGLSNTEIEPIQQALKDTELTRARDIWQRKFGQPPTTPKDRARQIRFLASRGFSPGILRQILGNLEELDIDP